jgi:hypothetical protein
MPLDAALKSEILTFQEHQITEYHIYGRLVKTIQ